MATRKGFCESKLSQVIANNIRNKKKQSNHWRFLSMAVKALEFFADVKRKVLKTQIEAFDYRAKSYGTFTIAPCLYGSLSKNGAIQKGKTKKISCPFFLF